MIANRVKIYSNPLAYTLLAVDTVALVGNPVTYQSLIQLDASHFVCAYHITAGNGKIAVISCDLTYGDLTVEDTLEHLTGDSEYVSLAKIDDSHVMLAYQSSDNHGWLKIFAVDGSYQITETSSLEHDTNATGGWNSLVAIDSTHYILAYAGLNSDGYIKTFSIDGAFAITEIDSLEHDTTNATGNSLIKIDATHYMLGYCGADSDGFLKVFTIDGAYEISETSVLEHDTVQGYIHCLVKLTATKYALAYSATDSYIGKIKTFSIDGAYAFTELDAEIFFNALCQQMDLCKIDNSHVLLSYRGTDNDGFMEVWEMDGTGALTETSSWEFSTIDSGYFDVVQINLNYYIMSWNFEPASNANVGTFIMS